MYFYPLYIYMKISLIIIFIVLVVRVSWSYFGTRSIERPKIISSTTISGNIALREMGPMIQATVSVTGTQSKAINEWFRQLAWYIFWWNTNKTSVAMTAPVGTKKTNSTIAMTAPVWATKTNSTIAMTAPVGTQKEGDTYLITVTMPSKYTIKTLPTPNNPNITFVDVPAKKYYVWKFSWYANEVRANKQLIMFQKALKEHNIITNTVAILNQYNDPWTIPFMRTNEWWIEAK